MSDYSEFFLNSDSNIVQLELLEIAHPNFSQTYYVVRNAMNGVEVTLETSAVVTFDYYPLTIVPMGAYDDLDQILHIELGDLNTLISAELKAVHAANGFGVKPTVIYRTYRSDDLSAPLSGPYRLEMRNLSFKKKGATFDAGAPRLNELSTGELYTIERFPMLRAFL